MADHVQVGEAIQVGQALGERGRDLDLPVHVRTAATDCSGMRSSVVYGERTTPIT